MMDSINKDNLTETRLRKILIDFERKFNDNQKLRIKHAESPTKFASSETELFAALDELQGIATQPELYHVLIAKKSLNTIISLVAHDNTDISAKVIGMLQEFTDLDEIEDQKSTEELIRTLLAANTIDLLVSNLTRLDESIKEESLAINNSLAIVDNLIDFDSSVATTGSDSLIRWMLGQIKKNPAFNSIKLSIAELLSVMLMNASENKIHLGNEGGIDVLLQQVAYYRRVAPTTGDEHEFLEQVINCLCTAILDCDQNRNSFFEEEGVDLVELILREKREAVKKSNIKLSTLKLFNHVLTTEKNVEPTVTKCCEKFVQVLGLRVLFPIFNNPKVILSEKVKRREYHQVLDEIEEHTSAIMLALLKYCQSSELIQRVLVKFAEGNFSKFDRVIQLHDKHYRVVRNNDEDHDGDFSGNSSSHFTLRTADYMILLICYLSRHFETYDPICGETFSNHLGKLLLHRRELRDQISLEVGKHINEVQSGCSEERNSLEYLLKFFQTMNCDPTSEQLDTINRDTESAGPTTTTPT